jgi:beta-N-acetylhexosaminidase
MRLKSFVKTLIIFGLVVLAFSISGPDCSSGRVEHANVFTLNDFYKMNPALDKKVKAIFDTMSEERRLAQVIISTLGASEKNRVKIDELVAKRFTGGIFINRGTREQMETWIKELSAIADKNGSLPLMFACDAEPSLINRKIKGLPLVPKTEEIKTSQQNIEIAGQISGWIKDLGFNINFAPVCDVGINQSIIKWRAYGKDLKTIGNLPSEFIEVTQSRNIVSTAKHFPGHGTVKGDTHKQLVYIDKNLVELPIFKKAIQSGVVMVMVGHIAVKNNPKFNTQNLPATLSPKIIKNLLRDSLGFKGLVVTDAMTMRAVSRIKDASLKAIKAGCDVILNPSNERLLIYNLKEEIKTDEALKKQVYGSIHKILRLKVCVGIIK